MLHFDTLAHSFDSSEEAQDAQQQDRWAKGSEPNDQKSLSESAGCAQALLRLEAHSSRALAPNH
jgi:hypothetical protein